MSKRAVLATAAFALVLATVWAQPSQPRLVAIGDIHGAGTRFSALLQRSALIGDRQQWLGGLATLVQTGDFTDRGPDVRAVMNLLMRLEAEAGPNENSANTTLSYYTKDGVIGFLLDARLRRATGGATSLDDALRLAYDRFSGKRGFTPQEFRTTVAEAAETNLDEWFEAALETVDELDYTEALDWYGLDLSYPDGSGKGENDSVAPAWPGHARRRWPSRRRGSAPRHPGVVCRRVQRGRRNPGGRSHPRWWR